MTNPIGSNPLSSWTPSLNGNHSNRNSGTGGNANNSSSEQEELLHPGTPVGPLGHNINTTA